MEEGIKDTEEQRRGRGEVRTAHKKEKGGERARKEGKSLKGFGLLMSPVGGNA